MAEAKKRILVVEDDTMLRASIEKAITDAGYEVKTAEDGVVALDAARRGKPDLIVLDIMLPGMDGIAVLKALRAEEEFAKTPVIALTNRDDLETIGDVLKEGATDFLAKHEWKLEQVVQRIRERLGEGP